MRGVVDDTISVGSIQRPWSLQVPSPSRWKSMESATYRTQRAASSTASILSIGVTVSASSTSGEADLPSVPQTRSRRPRGCRTGRSVRHPGGSPSHDPSTGCRQRRPLPPRRIPPQVFLPGWSFGSPSNPGCTRTGRSHCPFPRTRRTPGPLHRGIHPPRRTSRRCASAP